MFSPSTFYGRCWCFDVDYFDISTFDVQVLQSGLVNSSQRFVGQRRRVKWSNSRKFSLKQKIFIKNLFFRNIRSSKVCWNLFFRNIRSSKVCWNLFFRNIRSSKVCWNLFFRNIRSSKVYWFLSTIYLWNTWCIGIN
jgi:hypothetical protein